MMRQAKEAEGPRSRQRVGQNPKFTVEQIARRRKFRVRISRAFAVMRRARCVLESGAAPTNRRFVSWAVWFSSDFSRFLLLSRAFSFENPFCFVLAMFSGLATNFKASGNQILPRHVIARFALSRPHFHVLFARTCRLVVFFCRRLLLL